MSSPIRNPDVGETSCINPEPSRGSDGNTNNGETSCIKPEPNMVSDPNVKKEGSPPGSRTPKSPRSDGSPVSDETCPICLGHITDKCVTNSCFHHFCLVCLKEWAKQKPVCPLCKLRFTKIMHDIKSETEYKEYIVPRPEPPERSQGVVNFQEFLDQARRRFFGYRTTNFPGSAALRRLYPGGVRANTDSIPSGPRERRPMRYNVRGSSMFRLSVYENNVWVQPLADITGRYRQSGPDLYREQPALTHRLVPWVNRELAALLPSSRIGVVLNEVMELIERYSIDSAEFRRAMLPHLGRRTNHFVHEFYNFARSPYDMVGHDNAAQYMPRFSQVFDDLSFSSSSSDDSDAVVEVDIRGNPVPSTNNRILDPQLFERQEILTQEGSVVISSDEGSSVDSNEHNNHFMQEQLESTETSDLSATHNPEPPTSVGNMRRILNRAKNFLSSVNDGASTSRSDENSENTGAHGGTSTNPPSTLMNGRESTSNSDSDACIIVDEVSKMHKIPEIINLDSEVELSPKGSSHSKKNKKDKRKDGSSKTGKLKKQKPNLKRNNIISTDQSVSSNSSSNSSSNKKSSKNDHSYCSEQASAEFEASASTSNCHRSGQTSSIEISLKWHNHENYGSVVNVRNEKAARRHRNRIVISDSDSDSDYDGSQVVKHSCIEKVKHKKRYSKSNSSSKAREDEGESSSRHKKKSPRAKKDHLSKVKSSSRPTIKREHHSRYISNFEAQEPNHSHSRNSETSSNSVDTSDSLWTPSSSTHTERSLSRDRWYPDNFYSTDSTHETRNSSRREHVEESSSRSRHSSKKSRHKKESQHRSEKRKRSKKSKKTKHKKKSKTRKLDSSSDSDSDSDTSYDSVHRKSRKKKSVVDSSSSDSDDNSEMVLRQKPKRARKLSESSSS